jgi:hypothetical protein
VAFTVEQRDALQAAIASGVLTTTFGGRSVTYQSLEEMRAVLADMERALNPTTTYAYRLAAHDKGV